MEDQTVQLGVTIFPTPNTKLAATLLTLGVPFADDKDRVRNVYTDQRPYKPGAPGEVTYLLAGQTSEGDVLAGELKKAYDEAKADILLDRLVDEIERADPALGNRLRKLLPLALAVYGRTFLENRERILDLWKKSRPLVLIRRGPRAFTLVSRTASEETLRDFHLKK